MVVVVVVVVVFLIGALLTTGLLKLGRLTGVDDGFDVVVVVVVEA